MTCLLVGIILAQPQLAPAQDKLTIAGREVAIEFPDGGRFSESTPHVASNGWRYSKASPGSPSMRYKVDGGWSDVKSRWGAASSVSTRTPLHLRVFVISRVSLFDVGSDRVVRIRRGSIDGSRLRDLLAGLAQLKAIVDASADGAIDLRLHVTVDEDPALEDVRAPFAGDLFGAAFLKNEIQPRLNDDAFPTDDGRFNGPHSAAMVIHAGLTGTAQEHWLGQTPVSVVSFFGVWDHAPVRTLSPALYEAFRRLVFMRTWHHTPGPAQPRATATVPRIDGGPLWKAVLLTAARADRVDFATKAEAVEDLNPVPLELADLAFGEITDPSQVQPYGVTALTGTRRFACTEAEARSLGLVEPVTPGEPEDDSTLVTTGYLQFAPAPEGSPEGARAITVTGTLAIGRALVGQIEVPSSQRLAISIKRMTSDPIWLQTVSTSGMRTAWTLLGGDSWRPAESTGAVEFYDARVPLDDQFHRVVFPVNVPAGSRVRVFLSAGPFGSAYDRIASEGAWVVSTSATAANEGEAATPQVAIQSDSRLATLAAVGEGANEVALAAVRDGLASTDITLQANAAIAMTRIRDSASVPLLAGLARAPVLGTSYAATLALLYQGTPEAWAAIRHTVESAPFEHSRRFAALALVSAPDPTMAASLSQMGARSWRTRLAGTLALTEVSTQPAQIILVSTLSGEPDPCVRAAVCRAADPTFELSARRLLEAGINDVSEVVRAISLTRLLRSPQDSMRRRAQERIRDESVTVRLELLDAASERKSSDDLPMLRLALTDPIVAVRVRALGALAVQPGSVTIEDVRPVLQDAAPRVRTALEALAKTKGFRLNSQ